ncbi:Virulence factor MVIN-like protein [gut metagenome]|uniref:Virulence factor MVIN-like protein n=1 Tax=gut metagenome TaxID=749906 RepID=J9GCF1_9ZZZZ
MVNRFADAEPNIRRSWSAAGATMGTGAGVTVALLFMLFVYQVNRKRIQKKIARDKVSVGESYVDVMKTIVLIVAPIILSAFLYNVNGYVNSMIYTGVSGMKGLKNSVVEGLYAECGYFLTIINIPLTLSSTAPTSMMPEVSGYYAKGDIKTAKERIDKATWLSMFISIPCSVGLFVFGRTYYKTLVFHYRWNSRVFDDVRGYYCYYERNVQYLQWGITGHWQGKYSYDPCDHCFGMRCGCSGDFNVYY